jgi:rSAM/selenodomain-associated transferase 2
MNTSVSVVIPVLNDTAALSNLLGLLLDGAAVPQEIIVVAAGDISPVLLDLTRRHGVTLLKASAAGRGLQLRQGAEAAGSPILWFLHADSEPPTNAMSVIAHAIAAGAVGGYFRFRFIGAPTPARRALAAAINLRSRIGVPYGDQGIFCRRDAYHACNGFGTSPLFEEVPLIRGLRVQGRFVALPASMGVSPRRWERDGWIRRSLMNRLLALGFALGVAPDRLARMYRHGDRSH